MLKYSIWQSMTLEQKKEYKYKFGKPNEDKQVNMKCFRDMVLLMGIIFGFVFLMIIASKSLNNTYLLRSAVKVLDLSGAIFLAYLSGLLFSLAIFPIVDGISRKSWLKSEGLIKKKKKPVAEVENDDDDL